MLHVLEISRMTNHNGPGLRTLIHFKGCPLACVWCSTPESQDPGEELGVNYKRCIRCGACIDVCSAGALEADSSGIKLDRTKCTLCFQCVD